MSNRRYSNDRAEAAEAFFRSLATIGELEELAGIDRSDSGRTLFWVRFSSLPGASALDAGVTCLRSMILERIDRNDFSPLMPSLEPVAPAFRRV